MEGVSWLSALQTAGVLLAAAVAVGTIRARGDGRAATLAKMQADIEHILKKLDTLAEDARAGREASRRIEEHVKYDHARMERAKGAQRRMIQ